jgi:putative ATPase
LVLDLNAGTGLLTWEAVRQAPTGGVWALAATAQTAAALEQQAGNLESLERPVILTGTVIDLPQRMANGKGRTDKDSPFADAPFFDVIIGRNVLTHLADKAAVLQTIAALLKPGGRLALAEIVPRRAPRLHQLVDLVSLPDELVARLAAAEEAIYANPADPMVNWDTPDLEAGLTQAGLAHFEIANETLTSDLYIGPEQLQRWFGLAEEPGRRPTFAQHLLKNNAGLTQAELAELKDIFERQLLAQVVAWPSTIAYIAARKT